MILLILIIWQYSYGVNIITRDSQISKFTDGVDGFSCTNGLSNTQTVTFSGTFENIPQIILTLEKTDTFKATAQYLDAEFNIQSITLTSFDIYLKCPQRKVNSGWFRWYAIDNKRIEVINQFNVKSFQNYPISHSNPNALSGFISIIQVGYSGPLNFFINISSITSNSLYVEFHNPVDLRANIKSLSYQIILAPIGDIIINDTITATANFTSKVITLASNSYFLLPMQGFTYLNTDNIRLFISYLNTSQSYVQYFQDDWGGTFVTNKHAQIQLSFINYLPLKCSNVRISKMYSPTIPSKQLVFNIIELSTLFPEGTYILTLEESIALINLSIQFRCQVGKKISSSFLMYPENTGAKQMKSQSHICYSESNLITYYPRFIQQKVTFSQISIQITSTSCTISSILYNQIKTTINLMSLALIDI